MKRRVFGSIVIGGLINVSLLAQPVADVWGTLPKLPAGTLVRLTLSDGAELEGRLVEARADAIVLEGSQLLKGRFQIAAGVSLRDKLTFSRTDVTRVTTEALRRKGGRWSRLPAAVAMGALEAVAILYLAHAMVGACPC